MTNVFPTIEDTQNGSELVTELNQWRTSILELHGATSRPSYAVAGTMWRDITIATSQGIYVYDGSDDILIGTLDVTANKFYPGGDTAAAALTNLGLTATAAEINILDGVTATVSEINLLDGAVDHATSAWEAGSATEAGLPSPADVAAAVAAQRSWTETAVIATTSGTAFDVTSIPTDVTEIEVVLDRPALTGTDSFLLQIGTGGSPTTTGYNDCVSLTITPSANVAITSTSGFIVRGASAGINPRVVMTLRKMPGANKWISVISGGIVFSATSIGYSGGGDITLAGALDNLRLTRDGSDTFNAGQFYVRYR